MTTSTSPQRSLAPKVAPVPWFVLFFDLIVVASFSKVSKIYGADPTWANFGYVAVCILFLFALWGLTTLELLARDTWPRRALALVQVLSLLVAALSLGNKSSLDAEWGFAAVSLAVGTAAILTGMKAIGRKGDWRHDAAVAWWLCASSAIFFAAALLPHAAVAGGLYVWQWFLIAGTLVLVEVAAIQAPHALIEKKRVSDHEIQERLGLILIMVLGESFLLLLGSVGTDGTVARPIFLVATVVMVVAIWLIYFPSLGHAPIPRTRRGIRARMTAHLVLIIGSVDAIVACASLAKDSTNYGGAGGVSDSWTALPLVGIVGAIMWIHLLRERRWTSTITCHALTAVVVGCLAIIGMIVPTETANVLLLISIAVLFGDGVITVGMRARLVN